MKPSLTAICLTLVLSLGTISAAWSADCKTGIPAPMGSDPLTFMLEWQPLAKHGNANAQYKMGTIYDHGVLRNNKTAVKWYTLAAEQGNTDAQNALGGMYQKGKGVQQNYKTAVKWYRLAAEEGCADAQFNLGSMYFSGNGISKDRQIARTWWKFAAELGHPGGQEMVNLSIPWWKFWEFYGWWSFW